MVKYLNTNCRFVVGAKNAAIYDLVNNKVYAINHIGKTIIQKMSDASIAFDPDEINYLESLEKMGLICNHQTIEDAAVLEPADFSYAWLELTDNCNLSCLHCYGQWGKPVVELQSKMSLEEWKKTIDNLLIAGCKAIQFIGGEPFCFSGFEELLVHAKNNGMETIDIFTNGTLVSESHIELIKKTDASVRVSLYGHTAEIHETVTGCRGSFSKTETTLKLLKKHHVKTKIAIVIMDINEHYIEDIKKYITELGHEYTGYDTIRQVAGNVDSAHCVTSESALVQRYLTKPRFKTNAKLFNSNLYWNPCWSGKIAIKANGDVLPCIFARDVIIGNTLKNTICEILDMAKPFWQITLDKVKGCKDCEFRYACLDCRPLAIGINGGIEEKQPRCCYNPYTGDWQDIKYVSKEILHHGSTVM